jgi:hypothetical protein
MPFKLGNNYSEIWAKLDVRVSANYNHRQPTGSDNNKAFVWLWDTAYGMTSGRKGPKIGGHLWRDGGKSKFVPYVSAAIDGVYTLQYHYWSHVYYGAIDYSDFGSTFTLVIRFKYASIANNDGIYQMWKIKNGVTTQMFSITNGAWYSTSQTGEVQPGFDQGYIMGHANSGFDEDTYINIDNVIFSTESLL